MGGYGQEQHGVAVGSTVASLQEGSRFQPADRPEPFCVRFFWVRKFPPSV